MTIGYIIFTHIIPIAYTKELQVSSFLYEINLSLANKEKELSTFQHPKVSMSQPLNTRFLRITQVQELFQFSS